MSEFVIHDDAAALEAMAQALYEREAGSDAKWENAALSNRIWYRKRAAVALVVLKALPGAGVSRGALDVLAERTRQIEVDGWTAEHDDLWTDHELSLAAAAYALDEISRMAEPDGWNCTIREWLWPFGEEWWKPRDRRRDLVRAAALIIAEIDRLDRLPAPPAKEAKP